ncbi:hypothetical protein, partial [Escherichia coli]
MNIEQIFEKPLKRNINGVVKAEQTDDASAYIELDEYVITRELENHLRHFFESYVPATGPELKWFTEFGHLNRGDMLTS